MNLQIFMSKKRQGEKRHVVLTCDSWDAQHIHTIINQEVLQYRVRPVREFDRTRRKVRYRFAKKHLERLLLTFPFADVSPGLHRQLSRVAQLEYEQVDVPELNIPDFKGDLYDFQKIGVATMLRDLEQGVAFFNNDMVGLGKTYQALAALCSLEAVPALVVCPNNAKWVWERFITQLTDYGCQVVAGTAIERVEQIEKEADITVINYESVWRHPDELFTREYEMLIADEFHRIKNPTAKQTKGFHRLGAKKKLLMSGTPMLNRPDELWSPLKYAFPDEFPTHFTFVNQLSIRQGYETVGYRPDQVKKLKDTLTAHGIRRRKDEVIRDLPQVIPVIRPLDLNAEQRRIYNEILEDFRLRLQDDTYTSINDARVQTLRLRQACFSPELFDGSQHSAKVDELKDVVAELVGSGEKAIIYSQWSRATRIMQRELTQYNPAYVDGSVKGQDRMAQVDRFNEDDDCHLYIGTIGANKEAITLGAATYVILTDRDWSPMNNEQAIGRSAAGGLRGVGTHRPVHVIDLYANDTVEERIDRMLMNKMNIFRAVVERDGGVIPSRVRMSDLRQLFLQAS